jgi:hypothetical protein
LRGGNGNPTRAASRTLEAAFEHPPDDARIMMRWWWFGPAVTHEEMEREMLQMRAAGIGGFEVQPVYPLALDDPAQGMRILPFLSAGFLEALRFVSVKSNELGLRMDLTLGSGWPYGGPKVLVTQAAGLLRWEERPIRAEEHSVAIPSIEEGESLLGVWAIRDRDKPLSGGNTTELTVLGHGRVGRGSFEGAGILFFFISSRTGMMVKRPAVGAEGFVLDHYDKAAVESYLVATGSRLLGAFGANPPYAIFSDSLEVEHSNWTADLPAEFMRRRGYDLKPYLLALVGDTGPITEAVRCDWGRTLTELVNEHYLMPLRAWANRQGTRLRAQVYGPPPVTLSSNSLVDLPEGEAAGADWKHFSPSRWAASASHLYGRDVTSAETWTWIHSPAFRATPLDLKSEADQHFLQGINQIVGHGWPYSPPSAREPGWRFYAAGALNAHNPWWPAMPDLTLYLQRLSFLLRQGKPSNDVAVYLSNSDAWARFKVHMNPAMNEILAQMLGPTLIGTILDAGFNLDFIDDEAIDRVGVPYRALVLPGVERMPLATYRKIDSLAQQGLVVITTGRMPALAPGLQEMERDSPHIQAISGRLFGGGGEHAMFVPDESALGAVLARKLMPDVALSPRASDIGFIHRKLTAGDLYFLANAGNQRYNGTATFRVSGLVPERWDPLTGRIYKQQWQKTSDGRTVVPMRFEPYESFLLMFSEDGSAAAEVDPAAASESRRVDLSTDWKVSFPSAGKTLALHRLHSWTEYEDLRFFSGQAIYEKSFSLPEGFSPPGCRVYLNFGESAPIEPGPKHQNGHVAWIHSPVREAAVVFVNEERASSVWCPPYEVEIGQRLRPGKNDFRIEVGNLAINAMAGESLPNYRLLNDRYGRRFTPQDMKRLEPLPSGLLGPITLIVRG